MIKKSFLFFLKLFSFSSILIALVLLILYYSENTTYTYEILYGYLGSLFIFTLGFVSIVWSLKSSLKTFMSVVLGGMVVKFILLAVLIFLIMKYTNLNILYFIVTFVFFYIGYQFSESRFINAYVRKGKKWGVFSPGE